MRLHRLRSHHFAYDAIAPAYHLYRHLAWGGTLVAAGIVVLLQNQGLITRPQLWLIAPAFLVWSALLRLAFERNARGLMNAAGRIALAAYLAVVILHIGGWTFAATWPVLLIVAGVCTVAQALIWRDPGETGCWRRPSW